MNEQYELFETSGVVSVEGSLVMRTTLNTKVPAAETTKSSHSVGSATHIGMPQTVTNGEKEKS